MIKIAFALHDVEFDDVKKCTTTKEMWDKMTIVHGEDHNVLRAKAESMGGKYETWGWKKVRL